MDEALHAATRATMDEETEAEAAGRHPALLALLRVYLGVVFLAASVPKLGLEGGFERGLTGFVGRAVEGGGAHAFYAPFLEGVVLPNAGLFATVVVVGELLTGVALVTGAAARLAAGAAMFMTLNYMFLKGAWLWTPSSNDAAFFVIALVVLLGAAGRRWGVDAMLAERYPGVPLW